MIGFNTLGRYASRSDAVKRIKKVNTSLRGEYFVYDEVKKTVVYPVYKTKQARVNKAVSWALASARDNKRGYTCSGEFAKDGCKLKWGRWGKDGDYNCSSFVETAYELSGFVNLREIAEDKGFKITTPGGKRVTSFSSQNIIRTIKKSGKFRNVSSAYARKGMSALKKGDILIRYNAHTALYAGGGRIVEAWNNELWNGYVKSRPGDQTGWEIRIVPFRYGWTDVYRPKV